MHRQITRLVLAAVATAALAVGGLVAQPTATAAQGTTAASAATPCEDAIAAYDAAHVRFLTWKHKLARAKRLLHRAHAHGTAAEFQQAKNRVRHAKEQVFRFRTAMDEALAQEAAVC